MSSLMSLFPLSLFLSPLHMVILFLTFPWTTWLYNFYIKIASNTIVCSSLCFTCLYSICWNHLALAFTCVFIKLISVILGSFSAWDSQFRYESHLHTFILWVGSLFNVSPHINNELNLVIDHSMSRSSKFSSYTNKHLMITKSKDGIVKSKALHVTTILPKWRTYKKYFLILEWKDIMTKEFNSLLQNETWELVALLLSKKTITSNSK